MKKITTLLALSALQALAAMPIIIISPTLNFFLNQDAPSNYGGVKVLDAVTVNLYTSQTGTQLNVSGVSLAGDMLLITSKVNGTASSGSFVFKQAGTYRAFIDRGGNNLVSAGSFRILPAVTVDPVAPSTSDAVSVTLTVGEIVPGDCMPIYSAQATVKATGIYLTYQELAVGSCMSPADTMPVGPSFDLGKLTGGSYTIYIDDSVAVGSVNVTSPLTINGTAHIMTSRYVRSLPQPVADVLVSASQYEPCIWYILNAVAPGSYDDTTNASGMFSIVTPSNQSNYDVYASKNGFHPQAIPVDLSGPFAYDPDTGSVPFQLIPTVVNAEARLEIRVTENGAPLESAYVNLEAGRGIAFCPLAKSSAAIWPINSGLGGYTNKFGRLALDSISLEPYIDFTYGVSKYAVGKSLYTSGRIRLNVYDQDTLKINFGGTCVERIVSGPLSSLCSAAPNPFNPSTTLRVSHAGVRLAVYDIAGKLVRDFGAVRARSVVWSPLGLANGIYVVKAMDGKQTSIQKILFQK